MLPIGKRILGGALAVIISLLLHGCDMDVPRHSVGNWRAKADYLVSFEFVEAGQPAASAQLNSCMAKDAPATLQCSGRGYCKQWNLDSTRRNPVSFCECDRDWADPECRTRRKSQVTAFLCTLFGGFLGIDYFYLGFPLWGVVKLASLGGLGFWWLVDIVRTGAGPVYANNYRVANDLPHWVFVLSTVTIFSIVGFLASIESYLVYRKKKREDVMKLQEREEARHLSRPDEIEGPRFRVGAATTTFQEQHGFSGYGATLPVPHPNAGAPYAVPPAPGQPGRFAGPYGPAGIPGKCY